MRIGHGIDIHSFDENRPLILGGVTIPYELGLAGHSDADALTHALMDAILGAAGKPDIGVYFPNTDLRWKGSSSLSLLKIVWEDISKDYSFGNADIAVLLEQPKLRPHIVAMQENLSEILHVNTNQVNIKASTAEGLGFVGRAEGIYCSAVVLLNSL